MKAKQITTYHVKGEAKIWEKALAPEDESKSVKMIESNVINLYPDFAFQTIEGFGGAMTESSAYLLSRMDEETQNQALQDIFGPDGLHARFVRVPIDSCDYSLEEYQAVADPIADPDLATFSIDRDRKYVLPMLKKAIEISAEPISVLMSPWSPPLILEKIRQEKPDIIGFQEVLPHVAAWLKENLTEYYIAGCGREKDLTGEAMIIAYRKERFQSVSLETFWLSPTPYVPGSRYPVQSMCPRTATDVVFEDMETGKVFRVINTHLDHECAGARKLGLEQILAHLRAEKAFADVPVILSGDFNAEPDSEEMKPLRETAGLVNATEGIGITFHNYHRDDPNDPQCSIDYIILKGDWELKKVEKWTEQKDGVCLSDHYPICAELI